MATRILAIVIITAVLVLPSQAQWLNYPTAGVPLLPDGKPNLTAPAPKTADGKPDLSGLWLADKESGTGTSFAGEQLPPLFANIGAHMKGGLPFRPWARELANARKADNSKDSPEAKCLPLGIVWLHSHLFPAKLVQLPGLIVILYEKNTLYRQIFTDGRPLPVDPEPSFFGYSSGHWEGDTLVVHTIGFRDNWWADLNGDPLTDQAKIIERFHRANFGALEIEITVDDPKAYTAPWTVNLKQHLVPNSELLEFVCVDNEKNLPHIVGK